MKLYRQNDGTLSSVLPPVSSYSLSNRAIYNEIVVHCQEITGASSKASLSSHPLDLSKFDPLDSPSHPFSSDPWKDFTKICFKD